MSVLKYMLGRYWVPGSEWGRENHDNQDDRGAAAAHLGVVKVAGFDVQAQALSAKAASGYVPDTPNLYAKLTGRELLRFVGDLYNLDRGQAARRADELLHMFDLSSAADDTFEFLQSWHAAEDCTGRRPDA